MHESYQKCIESTLFYNDSLSVNLPSFSAKLKTPP